MSARTPDINLCAFALVHAPIGAPRSNVDCRCCASGNSLSSMTEPQAQSCGRQGRIRRRTQTLCISAYVQLCHRAADGPSNFLARDKHVRITATWIYDVFAAFQVVKTAGLPGVAAAHRQHPVNSLHNLVGLHFLCTVSAKAAKFVVRVAKSRCDCASQS